MKKRLFAMLTIGLLATAGAQEGEVKKEAGSAIAGEPAAAGGEQDMVKLLKDQLIVVDGEKVEAAELEAGKEFYLVYHSASWCGACKAVSSQLAKIQEKNLELDEVDRKFQMVLVGHDDSEQGVVEYLQSSKLGCAAVKTPISKMKFGEPVTDLLTTGYAGTIPAVLLLDKDGKLVTRDQREILLKLNKLARGKSQRVLEREAGAGEKAKAESAKSE